MRGRPSRSEFLSAAKEFIVPHEASSVGIHYIEQVQRDPDVLSVDEHVIENRRPSVPQRVVGWLVLKAWHPYLKSVVTRELEASGRTGYENLIEFAGQRVREIEHDLYSGVPLYIEAQARRSMRESLTVIDIEAFLSDPN